MRCAKREVVEGFRVKLEVGFCGESWIGQGSAGSAEDESGKVWKCWRLRGAAGCDKGLTAAVAQCYGLATSGDSSRAANCLKRTASLSAR